MVHEAAHVSLDDQVISASGWLAAQKADGKYISAYAQSYPSREDVAESFLAYFSARYVPSRISQSWKTKILTTIPNRIAYFDSLLSASDMKPFTRAKAPPPTVSIAAKAVSVTEGGNAVFTLTATPAPSADLTVKVTVTEAGGYATAGAQQVTIPKGGTATLTIATTDDTTDEPDGSVTATLATGNGYTVSTAKGAATMAVEDDDDAAPVVQCPATSADLVGTVRGYYDWNRSRADGGENWLRVLIAFGAETHDTLAPYTAAEARQEEQVWSGWRPVREELERLEACAGTQTAATTPEVSIAAGPSVTEGGNAVFTLTATPAPSAALTVEVTVTESGGYATAGTQQATIPTSGTATLSIATTGDDADEPDGSVTATLGTGSGYTVSTAQGADTVTVEDDDDPLPEISIAAKAASVTEGTAAVFTLTASPAPAAALTVEVTVTESGGYATAGTQQVTIPTSGTATLSIATTGDDVDEPDGSVTATLGTGSGYTVSTSHGTDTVTVEDDDDPLPEISIAAKAASVTEGTAAVFTLTATPAPAAAVTVEVTVTESGDYATAGTKQVTIPTSGTATLSIATTGDDVDEPNGSVTATLATGSGYTVSTAQGAATVAVEDDDAAPVSQQAVDDACVDAGLLSKVRQYHAEAHNAKAQARWAAVLQALGDAMGVTAMTAAEARTWHGTGPVWREKWAGIPEAISCRESATADDTDTDDGTVAVPEITITGGNAVTEGGTALFTVHADPAPATNLAVTLTVVVNGDIASVGASGTKTVTVPKGQTSASYNVATVDDATDEPDGSVTVTLGTGDGYTLGASKSATVAVEDDDTAPVTPEITVSGGNAITEGGTAAFTVHAAPAPAADLAVTLKIVVTGDMTAANTAGTKTLTIPKGETSASYSVATADDATDEPDGSVTVTLGTGDGYTLGASTSATVAVEDDDTPPAPEITVSGGSAVTEGGTASFTVHADPAPAADLAVTLKIAVTGDMTAAGTPGTKTLTIPKGESSASYTVATVDDATDEADGSVTATLAAGDGYTLGKANSASVSVTDDEVPVLTVTGGEAVSEGNPAAFTIHAAPVPWQDLAVTLKVAVTGDMTADDAAGKKTLTLPAGGASVSYTVATVDDDADEEDSTVTATLGSGDGYTLGKTVTASVAVTDDDEAAVLSTGTPTVSVADARRDEGWTAMHFEVTLSKPVSGWTVVFFHTRDSAPVSATGDVDYWAHPPGDGMKIWFRPGETKKKIGIFLHDDAHDEGEETFELVLSRVAYTRDEVTIGDGVAVGTIVNADPLPAAFLARFGRTVAEQALDGIAGRIAAPRTPGMQGTVAGQALNIDPAASGRALEGGTAPAMTDAGPAFPGSVSGAGGAGIAHGLGSASAALSDPFDDRYGSGLGDNPFATPSLQSHTMTTHEALLGSSFSLTGETDSAGGSLAFWGRASQGSFDGAERGDGMDISLDGTVTTGMLGADYARGNWLVGLALTQSSAEGGYGAVGGANPCPAGLENERPDLCGGAVRAGRGEVEASLTAAVPYAALEVSEHLRLWGAAGHGTGEVTLKTAPGSGAGAGSGKSYKADTAWTMAAAGMRSDLLVPPAEGSGPAFALTSDALWARTSSDKTGELKASDSDVTRLRLGLEGSWPMAVSDGGSLVPKLALGARHDGGDAETGFGIEVGGGIAWSDPALGLVVDLSGRTLLAHENDDLEDRGVSASLGFDPDPASERGLSLGVRQDWGGSASDGLDALFAPNPLEERTGNEATSRWTMEAAYGLPVFGDRFTGSPHAGLGLSTGARDYVLGWRLAPEGMTAPDLSFGLKAVRMESDTAAPEHTVGFEFSTRW